MQVDIDREHKIIGVKFILANGWTVALIREGDNPRKFKEATAIAYPAWMDSPEKLIPEMVEQGPEDVDDAALLAYAVRVSTYPTAEGPKMDLILPGV